MSVNSLNASVSALRANQLRLDVTGNNVANVNTDGFRASTVTSADNAYINDIGAGTRISSTYAPPRPGPLAIDTTGGQTAQGGQGAAPAGMVEMSNTDMVVEMTNMMSARNAYGANTVMGRTVDDTTQTLLDLKR